MKIRATLLGLGFALVAGSAFALPPPPPPPPLPPPPPSPSVVAHRIGADLHHATHPREWRHRGHLHRYCYRRNHAGRCVRWMRHR